MHALVFVRGKVLHAASKHNERSVKEALYTHLNLPSTRINRNEVSKLTEILHLSPRNHIHHGNVIDPPYIKVACVLTD